VVLLTKDNTRVIIRPSGTEPKVKFYIETVSPVKRDESFAGLSAIRRAAAEKLDNIKSEFNQKYASV
jgi:phosphomannomutase